MIVKTEAIVLITRNYSDSSKILVLFTKDKGKLSVLAKGATKPKSKFGYSVQSLVHSEVNYYEKSGRSLQILSSSEILTLFKNTQSDFKRLACGMMIAELVNISQHENEKNENIFNDILTALNLLNNKIDPFSVLIKFQIKLAKDMGFGLHYGKQLGFITTPNVLFSLDDCMLNNQSSFNYNIKRIYLEKLYKLQKTSLQSTKDFNLTAEEFSIINQLLAKYFSFHLDKKVKYKSYSLLNIT